jgi:hypothetical protein
MCTGYTLSALEGCCHTAKYALRRNHGVLYSCTALLTAMPLEDTALACKTLWTPIADAHPCVLRGFVFTTILLAWLRLIYSEVGCKA